MAGRPFSWAPATSKRRSPTMTAGPSVPLRRRASATTLPFRALARFSPTGGGLTGYSDALYTTQLSASATATGSTRCSLLAACERQLLEQAVAVPLFTQQKRLLVANGIEGLVFDPFGPVLDVTYATKG